MTHRILCVDDDASVLAGFQRILRQQFTVDVAVSAAEGLSSLEVGGPYAAIVADQEMPGMNGIQFLAECARRAPDTARVMLTGNADRQSAIDAVNEGKVFRFLTKPCSSESLAAALQAAVAQHRVAVAERDLLERTLNGTIKVLSDILAIVDPVAFGLGQKLQAGVRDYISRRSLAPNWELELAAMLCQLGYVTIPAAVLARFRSGTALGSGERDMLVRVPLTGSELLAQIPRLGRVAEIVLYQQKNFDGTGLPAEGGRGRDIPHGARVLRVLADMLALESRGTGRSLALAALRTRTGVYDPEVLEEVLTCYADRTVASAADAATVSLAGLCVHDVLAENIQTLDGTMLVGTGTTVTPVLLEKLRNFATVVGIREPLRVAERRSSG